MPSFSSSLFIRSRTSLILTLLTLLSVSQIHLFHHHQGEVKAYITTSRHTHGLGEAPNRSPPAKNAREKTIGLLFPLSFIRLQHKYTDTQLLLQAMRFTGTKICMENRDGYLLNQNQHQQ